MSFLERLLDAIGIIDEGSLPMSDLDVIHAERMAAIAEPLPTMDNAFACVSCRAIQVRPVNHRCGCGSSWLFDLGQYLTKMESSAVVVSRHTLRRRVLAFGPRSLRSKART